MLAALSMRVDCCKKLLNNPGNAADVEKINNAGNWNSSRNGITLRVTEYSSDVADWTFQGTGDTL